VTTSAFSAAVNWNMKSAGKRWLVPKVNLGNQKNFRQLARACRSHPVV